MFENFDGDNLDRRFDKKRLRLDESELKEKIEKANAFRRWAELNNISDDDLEKVIKEIYDYR